MVHKYLYAKKRISKSKNIKSSLDTKKLSSDFIKNNPSSCMSIKKNTHTKYYVL